MSRSRFPLRGTYPGTSISIDHTFFQPSTVLQMLIHVNDGPYGLDESLILTKSSLLGDPFVHQLRVINMLGIDDMPCNDYWEFLRGDHVIVTFPNTQNKTIGVELICREAQ